MYLRDSNPKSPLPGALGLKNWLAGRDDPSAVLIHVAGASGEEESKHIRVRLGLTELGQQD